MVSGNYEPIGPGQVMPMTSRMPTSHQETQPLSTINITSLERLTHCLTMIEALQSIPPAQTSPTPKVTGAVESASIIREYALRLEHNIANICKLIGKL